MEMEKLIKGKDLPWYTVNGVGGVLVELFTPVRHVDFVPFDQLKKEQIENIQEANEWCDFGVEIEQTWIINPENKQTLIEEWIDADDVLAEKFEQEYETRTTQYHEWTSRLTREAEAICDNRFTNLETCYQMLENVDDYIINHRMTFGDFVRRYADDYYADVSAKPKEIIAGIALANESPEDDDDRARIIEGYTDFLEDLFKRLKEYKKEKDCFLNLKF
jgi:hypothetical protein